MNGFVKLRITGEGLPIQDVTNKLERTPDFSYKKGDVFIDERFKRRPVIYKEDCWLVEAEKNNDESLEECIERFILGFNEKTSYLKEFSKRFNLTVWISAYPEKEQTNIHLSAETTAIIAAMGASIDYNIAFLKEFY